ncbi:ABC transporter ATP-binding protein [Parasedimentitalea huanghaiensis]|uniref:ATP-binding cassette domain-containing protein n=1 Tax=Parasedimentitalea huanghaiensis TaxID=2682100 RepID=A0A6L6WL85_9RHOB|nr:ABC transporter ATP-binding protein [Zongyanglinia huanghaiensis]MVO18211.1 ATP-binding cassette domain-containing protein [Zongyanglinia huanghaiensis]
MTTPLLEVSNLNVSYGPIAAVRGISFCVNAGELVTIIGANGAGKTSTLNAITGLATVASGTISFDGTDLLSLPVERKAQLGIGVSPEGRRVFGDLTVRENLIAGGISLPARQAEARIDTLVERFPILKERIDQESGTLSGGEQQMLAIARGLMTSPRFLILDEPSLGLAPKIVSQVFELVQQLNQEGVSILLVEQNVRKSLAIAHRAYVMELGQIVRDGDASNLAADPTIHQAYLGAA